MHFDTLEPRQLLASTATFTDVDGDIYRVDVLGNGSAAVVTSGGALQITAGSATSLSTFPADLSALSATARIGKITITQGFTAGSPSFSGGLFIAPTIGDITVNGLTNTTSTNDGGVAFGFGARTFGKITLKNDAGQTVKPVISTTGPINPLAPQTSGRFTLFAFA